MGALAHIFHQVIVVGKQGQLGLKITRHIVVKDNSINAVFYVFAGGSTAGNKDRYTACERFMNNKAERFITQRRHNNDPRPGKPFVKVFKI